MLLNVKGRKNKWDRLCQALFTFPKVLQNYFPNDS